MEIKAFGLLFAVLLFLASQQSWALAILPSGNQSAAFLNGTVATISYVKNYTCSPALSSIYSNISSITNVTNCGIVQPQSVLGTFPVWVLVPSFASFSTYGLMQFNSTADGFATYNSNVILTDCGAGGTASACPNTPAYLFDPNAFYAEDYYGINNGIARLPEGLLPMPAHDIIVLNSYFGAPIPWYAVIVRVFDPNIFPNATNGRCRQVAPSNLSKPTGNCLTSLNAIRRAEMTRNSEIPLVNSNNPIWIYEGNSTRQVVISMQANINGISDVLYPNTNAYLSFDVNGTNYYARAIRASRDKSVVYVGVAVVSIAILTIAWLAFEERRSPRGRR